MFKREVHIIILLMSLVSWCRIKLENIINILKFFFLELSNNFVLYISSWWTQRKAEMNSTNKTRHSQLNIWISRDVPSGFKNPFGDPNLSSTYLRLFCFELSKANVLSNCVQLYKWVLIILSKKNNFGNLSCQTYLDNGNQWWKQGFYQEF